MGIESFAGVKRGPQRSDGFVVSTLRLNLSRRTLAPVPGEETWGPVEIVSRLRGARGLGVLARYGYVRLCVDDVDELLSPRPLIAARLLSHGRARIEDASGRVREIGWGDLAVVLGACIVGALSWPAIERAIRGDLASLDAPKAMAMTPGDGVLAVRTDLWFGLEAGGAVAHSAGILNAFAAEGHAVRLLTSHSLPMLSVAVEQIRTPRARRWRPRPEQTLLAYNRDLIAAAARLAPPGIVYQRHGLYGYAGAVLARRWGARFVLEHNGSEVWIGDHWGVPVPARDLALEIERRMLAAADLVTVVSKPLVDQVVALGAPRERVLVCPNAVDLAHYRPDLDGGGVRTRYGLGGAIVIGFIGTFGPWHGARLLAEAFADLARAHPKLNVRLLMIGDGPERAAAQDAITRAELSQRAVFTGLVPQAEGAAHLAAADILVSPTLANPDGSAFFGSPTKLFEYMAMGRAIVASDMAQMAEILEHERTALLVAPGDRAALAEALARLVRDAELRKRLGASARAEVESKHGWARRVRKITAALAALSA